MASLYTDPQWSTNTAAALARLTQPGPEVDDIMAWLKVRSEQKDFSLSDLWGSLLSSSIMKQVKGDGPLSSGSRLRGGALAVMSG